MNMSFSQVVFGRGYEGFRRSAGIGSATPDNVYDALQVARMDPLEMICSL